MSNDTSIYTLSEAASTGNWASRSTLSAMVTDGRLPHRRIRNVVIVTEQALNEAFQKVCQCGKVFIPDRADAKHCSDACKQRLWRLAHGPKVDQLMNAYESINTKIKPLLEAAYAQMDVKDK